MKLKNFFKLATVLVLPFSLLSCGDDKKDDESSSSDKKTEDPAPKTHEGIGKEVAAVMEKLIASMGEIKDLESAQAFATLAEEQRGTLTTLLAEAKKLDPPTEEEKAAIQKLKDATDAKGDLAEQAMQEAVGQSADLPQIGAALMSAMGHPDMAAAMDGIKELYGLSD